jgi:hypothetical protein
LEIEWQNDQPEQPNISAQSLDRIVEALGIPAHLLRDASEYEWGASRLVNAFRFTSIAETLDGYTMALMRSFGQRGWFLAMAQPKIPVRLKDTKRLLLAGPTNFTPPTKRQFWERHD